MHLDHDHVGSPVEHSHSYHTHPHDHDHDHHEHDHGDAPHTHEGQEHCAGLTAGPRRLPAHAHGRADGLMKYMVGHNAAHAQELAGLAKQLEEARHTAPMSR